MDRRLLRWGRLGAGPAIVALLIWKLGTGPFIAGVRAVNGWSLAMAAAITVLTTACSAWRWTLVARGLGVHLATRTALMAYYRAQFLNTVLPGGVLGDVHRALAHGRDTGSLLRAGRAVVWERLAAQMVQVALAVLVLLILPSPASLVIPLAASAGVATVAVALLLLRRNRHRHRHRHRTPRPLQYLRADLRDGVLARRSWPGIAATSAVAVCGYAAMFLVAARTAGVTAPVGSLLPPTALVLLAMAVPANIGGWGPREGASAWAFGASCLGAQQGVAAATVYGVLVMAANLPGAAVLLIPRLSRDSSSRRVANRHAAAGERARRHVAGTQILTEEPTRG
jgi:glycosyltransferase 2 family protein